VRGVGGHLGGHGDDVEDAGDAVAVERGQLGVDVVVRGGGEELEADAVEARVVGAGEGGGRAVEAGVEAAEGVRVALDGAGVRGDAGGDAVLGRGELSRVLSSLLAPLLLVADDACVCCASAAGVGCAQPTFALAAPPLAELVSAAVGIVVDGFFLSRFVFR
jgi:hypothetical protein